MTNCLIITILILPVLIANDSNVKYTDDGAIITGLGVFELNNPEPITFEYDNIASCVGDFLICYKSLDPFPGSEEACGRGFHAILADIELDMMSGFRRSVVDSKTRFTFEKLSTYAKPPDISNGLIYYRVTMLPTGCTIKILGATDPNSTTNATDSLKTAKLVIYILAGAAGAILLILSCTKADDSNVKYTDDGAIITGLGFITLNNPDPMTFELESYQQCTGHLNICYKALTPSAGSSPPCELGFQKFVIHNLKRTSGFRDTEHGANMRFTLAKESPFGIPPDVSDGSYHYQVLELPKNCNFKVVGATDPNPPVTTDPLKTAKLVIYILAGLAGLILILAIGFVTYCICYKRRKTSTNSRNADESSRVNGARMDQ